MEDKRAEPRGIGSVVCGGACPSAAQTGTATRMKGGSHQKNVDRPGGEPACLVAGLTAFRLVEVANPD
mgnify:CR=1|jgi:hypothetical protein